MASVMYMMTLALLVALLAFGWRCYKSSTHLPPVVEGFFLPEYRPVAELFRRYVEDGTERGASLAVYHDGQPLVDLWGGYADPDSRRPWRNNTVTMTWSCTKGATALAVAKLVDKGLLDYKTKIAHYWPEFAHNDKDNITLEMLMSHKAGLVTLGGHTISLLQYKHDWQRVEYMMANVAPDYPPGKELIYHAMTFAMYVDALIRRVDPQHRNLSQYFDEEIAKPFGIDFHIGLPLELYHRAARQHFTSVAESVALLFRPAYIPHVWRTLTAPDSLENRAMKVLDSLTSSIEILNDPLQMEVGLGSLMGFGSASSLAKMYDILANEGAAGSKVLLSKSLVNLLSVPVADTVSDELGNLDSLFSYGFQLTKNVWDQVMFGHSGGGGHQAWADPTNRLGISYVTNFHWAGSSSSSNSIAAPPYHYLQLQHVFYHCFNLHRSKTQS